MRIAHAGNNADELARQLSLRTFPQRLRDLHIDFVASLVSAMASQFSREGPPGGDNLSLETSDLQAIRLTLESLGQLTPAQQQRGGEDVRGWISPVTPIPVDHSMAAQMSPIDVSIAQGRGSPLTQQYERRQALRPPPIQTDKEGGLSSDNSTPVGGSSSSTRFSSIPVCAGTTGVASAARRPDSPVTPPVPDRGNGRDPVTPSSAQSGASGASGASEGSHSKPEVHYHINWYGNPNGQGGPRGMGSYVDPSVINPMSQSQYHPQVQGFATRGGYIYADPSHPMAVAPHSLVNDLAPGGGAMGVGSDSGSGLRGGHGSSSSAPAAHHFSQLTHTAPPVDPERLPRHLQTVLDRAATEFQASLAVKRGNTLRNLKDALRIGSDAHVVEERGRLERENSLRGISRASRENPGKLDAFELEQLAKSIGNKLVRVAAELFSESLSLGQSAKVHDDGSDAWDPSTHQDQFKMSQAGARTHHPQDPSDPNYHVLLDSDDAQAMIRDTLEGLKKRLLSLLEADVEDNARSKLVEAEALMSQRKVHWDNLTNADVTAINTSKIQELQRLADERRGSGGGGGHEWFLSEAQVADFERTARQSTHAVQVEYERLLGDILETFRATSASVETGSDPTEDAAAAAASSSSAASASLGGGRNGYGLLSRLRYMALQSEFSLQELQRLESSLLRERDALQIKLAVLPSAENMDREGLLHSRGAAETSLVTSLAKMHLVI